MMKYQRDSYVRKFFLKTRLPGFRKDNYVLKIMNLLQAS